MGPRITIVTPSFQQGSFIERTLLSILDQGVGDLELLVIDGGSRDETVDILKRMARKDARIRWVSEPDRGQSHAVNKGLARARGEIIGWLNSDDVYYPGALSRVLDHFRRHPEIDIVYGDGDHIDEHGNVLGRYPTEPFDAERLWEADFISQPSAFFRRHVVHECGYLNESLHYCLDYEYWLRLATGGMQFAYLPAALSGSRLHDGAKTIKNRRAMHAEVNDMLREKRGRVPARWLLNYALVSTGADGRIRISTPVRFLAALPVVVWSAFHWNGSLNRGDVSAWTAGVRDKAQRAWERRRAA